MKVNLPYCVMVCYYFVRPSTSLTFLVNPCGYVHCTIHPVEKHCHGLLISVQCIAVKVLTKEFSQYVQYELHIRALIAYYYFSRK